ncbi:MAG: tetratricopeptide repeat protein [Kiritimatiellaeota bacterium]|nr:tetratricopeptide repeat protein [Kiritimatiellota bacterium]
MADDIVQVSAAVRNLYNKALVALERENVDFAIQLLVKCIDSCPPFLAARRTLRLAEVAKYKRSKKGGLAQKIATLTQVPLTVKAQTLLKTGKNVEALAAMEQLMLADPLNVTYGKMYADAAVAAGQSPAAIMTLEIIKEHHPGSLDILERLGKLYREAKDYHAARDCFATLLEKRPNDIELLKLLKDTEAQATVSAGWEQAEAEGKDYRAVLANKEQAAQLERQDKAVKTADDAEALIEEAKGKIAAEPGNMNYYLSLGSLFVQQKRYDEALAVFADARKINAADPELDRRFSTTTVAKFDAEIAALQEAGEADAAAAKETERNQYVFDDLADRVQRYPNDLRLRYELGLQYFQYEHYDDAIQQFQTAQRSPKDRVQAIYYMSLCFKAKGLLDMAIMQLEQAIELLPSMNAEKMDVYYVLADLYHEEGKLDDAARLYKDIYRADVTYKDIAKKIEAIYAEQKAKK